MKKLPYLLFFFTVVCLGFLSYLSHRHREPLKHCPLRDFESAQEEQQFMDQWYAGVNDVYFGNRLPKDTKINLTEIPPDVVADSAIAQTIPLGNHEYIIEIDPRFNSSGNDLAMSISHEMCHIELLQIDGKGDPRHGSRFQACMKRLAAADAFSDVW